MYSYLLLFISVSPEFVPVEVTQRVNLNEDVDAFDLYLRGGFQTVRAGADEFVPNPTFSAGGGSSDVTAWATTAQIQPSVFSFAAGGGGAAGSGQGVPSSDHFRTVQATFTLQPGYVAHSLQWTVLIPPEIEVTTVVPGGS